MATFYVDTVNGLSANDGLTSATAVDTLQSGVDLCSTAGDIVLYYTNSATNAESISVRVDLDSVAGSDGNWCQVIGTNSSFVDDGTQAVVDASGSSNGGIRFGSFKWRVKNVKVTGATGGACFIFASSQNTLYKCEALSPSVQQGIDMGGSTDCVVVNCKVTGVATNRYCIYNPGIACRIMYNYLGQGGVNGIYIPGASKTIVIGNIVHDVAAAGIECISTGMIIMHNTIDTITTDGIKLFGQDRNQPVVMFNRLTNCGGYGVNVGSGTSCLGDYNAFYSCSSGNTTGNYTGGDNDVSMSGDGYTDSTNHDFTLTDIAEAVNLSFQIGCC